MHTIKKVTYYDLHKDVYLNYRAQIYTTMPHHEHKDKKIEDDDLRRMKTLIYPDASTKDFSIDTWKTSYSDVRRMFSIDQTIEFVNRKGDALRDESSALGTKTKVIKLRKTKV